MSASTIPMNEEGSSKGLVPSKDEITGMLKKTMHGVKTGMSSSKSIAAKTAEMIKDYSVKAQENRVVEVTKEKTVKAYNNTFTFLLRVGLFILIAFYLLTGAFTIGMVYTLLFNTILNFQSSLGPVGVYYTSMGLTTLATIVVATFIFIPEKNKNNWFKWEGIITIAIIVIIMIVSSVSNSSLFTVYTEEERSEIILQEIDAKTTSFWEELNCALTADVACFNAKANTNEAEVIERDSITIKFYDYTKASRFEDMDLKKPLILDYQIENNGEMIFKEIKCYIESVKDENLFYTIPAEEIKNFRGEGNLMTNEGDYVACEGLYEAVLKHQESDEDELKVIAVANIELETSYAQSIPVVNYPEFLETYSGEVGMTLSSELKKLSKEYQTYRLSNNALKIEESISVNDLPLKFGDLYPEQKVRIQLVFDKKINSFQKYKSGKIVEINLPTSLTYDENFGEDNVYSEVLLKEDTFTKILYLKENSGYTPNFGGQLFSTQDLKLKFVSEFERRDSLTINVKSTTYKEYQKIKETENNEVNEPTQTTEGNLNTVYEMNPDWITQETILMTNSHQVGIYEIQYLISNGEMQDPEGEIKEFVQESLQIIEQKKQLLKSEMTQQEINQYNSLDEKYFETIDFLFVEIQNENPNEVAQLEQARNDLNNIEQILS